MSDIAKEFERRVQQCKDYNRDKTEGFTVPLFHATTDKQSVCLEGLKPRCELKGKCGLGGGPDDTVSFTTNPLLAGNIAKDLQTMVGIANGTITFKTIEEWLDKQDKTEGMTITPSKLWNQAVRGEYKPLDLSVINTRYIDHFDQLLKGFRYEYGGILYTNKDWKKKYPNQKIDYNTEINRDMKEFMEKHGETSPVKSDAYIEMTPNDEKDALFDLWRNNYLTSRGHKSARGRENPYFWGGPHVLKGVEHLDIDDTAVVEVEGSIHEPLNKILSYLSYNPDYRNTIREHGWDYASGLEEIRLNPRRFNKLQLREDICCAVKNKKEREFKENS